MDTIVNGLIWIFVIEIFSFATFPLISLIFSGLRDKGFAISKFLSILLSAYLVWIVVSLHIAVFSRILTVVISLIVLGFSLMCSVIYIKIREKIIGRLLEENEVRELQSSDIIQPTLTEEQILQPKKQFLQKLLQNSKLNTMVLHIVKNQKKLSTKEYKRINKIIIIEEILFLLAFLIALYIRGINPDIMGTEKFMDFGIINTLLKSSYFPPRDMWLSGYSLNYYYFGQYIFAFLTKLTAIPSQYTYNFSLPTIFALSVILSFSIVYTLSKKIYAGIISALVLGLAGNLNFAATVIQYFFTHASLKEFTYWYPTATRLIPNTINEYPLYSFIVADLHAHVTDIPIVLMTLLCCLNIFYKKIFSLVDLVLLGFLIGTIAITNSWDAIFYTSIFLITMLYIYYIDGSFQAFSNFKPMKKLIDLQSSLRASENSRMRYFGEQISIIQAVILVGVSGIFGIILYIPYYLHFKAPVDGIGFNTMAHSDIGTELILFGFFFFFIISFWIFLVAIIRMKKKIYPADLFVFYLIILGIVLLILPEFFYLKDIFYKANPPYFRANTVFKLYYQAWILFALSIGYIIARLISFWKRLHSKLGNIIFISWTLCTSILFTAAFSYTLEAINEAALNISVSNTPIAGETCTFTICQAAFKTANGESYIQNQHFQDYEIINWLNLHANPSAVIVEAVGDSYTYYARISVNTGLATVLGWPNHEYQWRNSYDQPGVRTTDVSTLYTTTDTTVLKQLVNKYKIRYIIVGEQERLKYPTLSDSILKKVGKVVEIDGNSFIVDTQI